MKDARGLDVTTDDATAVAAADDFAARLLRLDQGVEAILDAAKRWPDTAGGDRLLDRGRPSARVRRALDEHARARAPSGARALAWQ